ncbi:MAG: PilN domain-containing protein [Clostridiales bacterium]|jgi:Tfp pilus assembly protein PilN|nr:PilN domain-containing protein [Clostridiales bacterium]
MNDINLLNGFYQPKRTVKIISAIIVAIVVTGILSYIGIIIPLRNKQALSFEAAKFTQLNMEYENIEKEYMDLFQQVEELKKKADSISPVITGIKWSEVLSLIEQVIPQGIAINSLSYGEGVLTVQGQADSDIEIARFMVQLKNAGLFSQVKLKRIDGDGDEGSFVLLCFF